MPGTAGDLQAAIRIDRFQAFDLGHDLFRRRHVGHPQIDRGGAFAGDHVVHGAAGNGPDGTGDVAVVIGQRFQGQDLVRHFLDRAAPVHVARARVGLAPGHGDFVFQAAVAR